MADSDKPDQRVLSTLKIMRAFKRLHGDPPESTGETPVADKPKKPSVDPPLGGSSGVPVPGAPVALTPTPLDVTSEPTNAAMENMRRDFERESASRIEQSERSSGKATLAGSPAMHTPDRPGTKILDYIGLGLLLAPPAVVVEIYLRGDTVEWRKSVIAVIACWVAGGLVVWASHGWQAWRTTNNRLPPHLAKFESRVWGKAVIVAAAIGFALILRSVLSSEHPPTKVGFTQQQVDERVTSATTPLVAQVKQLKDSLADMTRHRDSALTHQQQAMPAKTRFSDQQRQDFESALRYRNLSHPSLTGTPIKIYAETSNSLKASIFSDMLLAAGWHPITDVVGSTVLKPDFNIPPGITIVRPIKGNDQMIAGWGAIRESLSQAQIPFDDGMPIQMDAVLIEIGQ